MYNARIITAIYSLMLILSFSATATESKALIIGVNYYAEFTPVDGAMDYVKKIKAFYNSDQQKDVQLKVMSDHDDGTEMFPLKSNIMRQIEMMVAECRPNENILIVYIGQTAEINDKLYLVPGDGSPEDRKTLISFEELNILFSLSTGKINFISLLKPFPGKKQFVPANSDTQVGWASIPFSASSFTRFIEGISGGADLWRRGNKNDSVELGEFVTFLSRKKVRGIINPDRVVADNGTLLKNSHYAALDGMNDMKEICLRTIKNEIVLDNIRSDGAEQGEVDRLLAKGAYFDACIKAVSLKEKYKTILENCNLQSSAEALMAETLEYEKVLIDKGATSQFPSEFTALIIQKDKAVSRFNHGNYSQALKDYTALAEQYMLMNHKLLEKEYSNCFNKQELAVISSFGGEIWQKLTNEKQKQEKALKDNDYKKSLELLNKIIAQLPEALKETAGNLEEKILRFSTPSDYKTALVFVKELDKLSEYKESAASYRKNIENNIRFKVGSLYTSKTGMKLAYLPGGEFFMGSSASEPGRDDDENLHHVTLSRGFFIGVYEVTEGEWLRVMGKNYKSPEGGGDSDAEYSSVGHPTFPKNYVSWNDAVEFCKKISELDGVNYRLPTEAEWEYACRAGSQSIYNISVKKMYSAYANVFDGYSAQYGLKAVGSYKRPNKWGLYDMHGNVWEWCADWKGPYSKGKAVDPQGPVVEREGATKVVRGGSWFDDGNSARSANRWESEPIISSAYIGFRVVLEPESIQ